MKLSFEEVTQGGELCHSLSHSVSKSILKMLPVQDLSFFEVPFRVWKPFLLTFWNALLWKVLVRDVALTFFRVTLYVTCHTGPTYYCFGPLLSQWPFPGYRHMLMYFHRTLSLRSLWTPASQEPGSHFVHTDTACFHVLWHAHRNVINHTARGTHAVSNV